MRGTIELNIKAIAKYDRDNGLRIPNTKILSNCCNNKNNIIITPKLLSLNSIVICSPWFLNLLSFF